MSLLTLLGNLRDTVAAPWSEVALVLAAFACGAIVGIERERQDKPAGLRTIMLICGGSAIFTIASMATPLGVREPARIAAQIVTGVGFLGAGSIMRDHFGISGLTTAATIWVTSGIGIVVGAGYAIPGLALSLAVLATLVAVARAERIVNGACSKNQVRIRYRHGGGKGLIRIRSIVDDSKGPLHLGAPQPVDEQTSEIMLDHCDVHREHRVVLARLTDVPEVTELQT